MNNSACLEDKLKEFAEQQRKILQREIDQEIKNAEKLLDNCDLDELEEKGLVIQNLEYAFSRIISYGDYEYTFKRRSRRRQQNVFFQGDVIEFYYISNDGEDQKKSQRGHINSINEYDISLIFKEEIDEESGISSGFLLKLYDCEFKKIFDILLKLEACDLKDYNIELLETLFGSKLKEANFESKGLTLSDTFSDTSINLNYINSNLNEDQRSCVETAMKNKNLFIIHGPPGTGKTSTLVEIILQNLERAKTILVVSPSNVAIDTIAERLLKYIDEDSDQVCRIGHPTRLLEEVKRISVDEILGRKPNIKNIIEKISNSTSKSDKNGLIQKLKSIRREEVFNLFDKCNVFMATTVSSGSRELQDYLESRTTYFDLVIIDECAQSKEGECFIPILQGKKLIIAGDHHQLTAVYKDKTNLLSETVTFFERMYKRFLTNPDIMRSLKVQYRMNEKIQNFSSSYFYENKLIPHETVKNHTIWTKESTKISTIKKQNEIYFKCPLIFIDTSSVMVPEMEEPEMKSKYNFLEIKIIEKFTRFILNYIDQENIGIITPYSAQVKKFHKIFENFKELEIETVDGFQGREKEVIIISTVRSNNRGDIGFLRDAKRMNVAITRAKRLLVVVCNSETLKYDDFLYKMINYFGVNSLRLTPELILTQEDLNTIKNESMATSNFNQFYNYNKLNHISLNNQNMYSVTNKNLIVQQMQGLYKNYLNNYSFSTNFYNVKYHPSLHETRYDSDLIGYRKATKLNINACPYIPKSKRLKNRKGKENKVSNQLSKDTYYPNGNEKISGKLVEEIKADSSYYNYDSPNPTPLEKEGSVTSENSESKQKTEINKKSKNKNKKKWVDMNVDLKFDRTDCVEVVTNTWQRSQQVKQDKIKKIETTNLSIKQKLRQDYYNYLSKNKDKQKHKNENKNLSTLSREKSNTSLSQSFGFSEKIKNVNEANKNERLSDYQNSKKNEVKNSLETPSKLSTPKPNTKLDLFQNKSLESSLSLRQSKNIEQNQIDYSKNDYEVNLSKKTENENTNYYISTTTGAKNLPSPTPTEQTNENKNDNSKQINCFKLRKLVAKAFQTQEYLNLEDFNYSRSQIKFVSSYKDFENILNLLSKTKVLGLDSEWYQSKTALFQISSFTETYLFDLQPDPINLDNSNKRHEIFRRYISEIFRDKSILKVAWDFNHDLEQLLLRFENEDNCESRSSDKLNVKYTRSSSSDYPVDRIENYLELYNYSDQRQGYSNLCKTVYKKSLDKSNQCSKWHIRPLTEDLIIYAALDTISCVDIYKKLIEKQIPIQTSCLIYKVDSGSYFKNIRSNIKSTFLK